MPRRKAAAHRWLRLYFETAIMVYCNCVTILVSYQRTLRERLATTVLLPHSAVNELWYRFHCSLHTYIHFPRYLRSKRSRRPRFLEMAVS